MSKSSETDKLKINLNNQLKRLLSQLDDIEETKDDLGDEYISLKEETLEQLEEMKCALNKMEDGKMSLIDEISNMQLMIQVGTAK